MALLVFFLPMLFELIEGMNSYLPKDKLHQFPVKTRLSKFNKIISLKNSHNVEYLLTVKIGSNKTEFDVLLDTTSSDFWLPSHNCKGCKQKKRFHCGLSSTCFTDFSEPVRGIYQDGPVDGFVAYDQVSIGTDINLPRQSFFLISSCSGSISELGGVFGLSYSLPSPNSIPSVMDNLLNSGQINSQIFSLYLSPENEDQKSTLILGGVEKSLIKDNVAIYWINFPDPTSIRIKNNALRLDSLALQLWTSDAVLDSGNTCVTFPRKMITHISSLLLSNYNIRCHFYKETYAPDFSMMDCFLDEQSSSEFPVISFNLEGGVFALEPKDYIYECVKVKKNNTLKCYTKFELSEKNDFLVLGMAFYNAYYVVFDLKNKKIGIAPSIAKNSFKVFNFDKKILGNARNMSEVYQLFEATEVKEVDPVNEWVPIEEIKTPKTVPSHGNAPIIPMHVGKTEDRGFGTYHIVVTVIAVPIGICIVFLGVVLYKVISKKVIDPQT